MNILDALKQLRDDLKSWVTINLNALNAKIDEKTIPIDSELSSTSINPVQNQAISKEIDSINDRIGDTSVATQISQAINAKEHFSGDYNDLTNAPNIFEDDSGDMVISDESGNIIFKVDVDGMNTTAVSINGETAATEKYVDAAIANIDIPEVDLTGYVTEDFVISAVNSVKEELSESIVAESDEWKVVDEAENIIFSVDANGAHTTSLTLNGKSFDSIIDERLVSFVDDSLSNISTNPVQNKIITKAITDINSLVGDTAVSEQISAAIDEATADDFGIYVQDVEPTDAVAGDIWVDTANDPSYIPPTIPEITEADNGKVLMVVNGKLQLVSLNLSIDANGVVSV